MSFWIPLLIALDEGEDKMIIVVTLSNLLEKQTKAQLNAAGLDCIALNKWNNEPETYKVCGLFPCRFYHLNRQSGHSFGEISCRYH